MAIELRNINPAVFDYNVGIGTASPNTKLAVIGDVAIGTASAIALPSGLPAASQTLSIVSTSVSYGTGILARRGGDSATGFNLWNYSYGTYLDDHYDNASAKIYFRLRTAGTPVTAMTLAASGNVGIGTTSPAELLDVRHATATSMTVARFGSTSYYGKVEIDGSGSLVLRNGTSATGYIHLSNSGLGIGISSALPLTVHGSVGSQVAKIGSGSYSMVFGVDGSGYPWVGTDGGLDFRIRTNNAERLTVSSSGYVGIGTASPGAKLHISGTGGVNAIITGTTQSYLRFSNETGSNSTGFAIGRSISVDNAHNFFVYDSTNSTTRFFIDATGKVGIGTTSPASRLHVYGTDDFTQRVTVDGTGNISSYKLRYNGSEVFFIQNYQNSEINIGTPATAFLSFYTSSAERARITATGYVGIGTPSPTEKLHVSGNLKIEGLLKFQDGTSYPSAAASASRAMACPIDGARGVYDNDVLWLWDGTYRTVNEYQYYIGRTESHATDGGSARVLDVLTTTGGGTFNDVSYYATTWNDNYMIGVVTAASVGAPTTWVTATLPCDPSVHNVLHVKVISIDRWQIVGAYILNSAGALQSKLQSHGNANYNDSNADISTVGPRNSAAKTTCCHEWVSIIIPKAHLTSHAYANANSPTGYSVKIALYNGYASGSSLYISGLGISRNPTGFVHVNAIDLHWATNGGATTNWHGGWNRDSMNQINAHTNYSDIRIPIAGTDRDILIGAVDHGAQDLGGPGAIFWLNNYNQPSIPNATFYLSNLVTGTYGKMNIGLKYRGFSGFVVPKALVQAYAQTYLGQQYLSFYIYNLRNDNNVHFRAMYSEQVNRIGNSKSITGAAFNMKNSNYKAADIVDVSTYDGY